VSKKSVIGTHKTNVIASPLTGAVVRYHATDVITHTPDGLLTLNTGGWFTRTTAKRMNQYLQAAGIKACVSVSKGKWYYKALAPYNVLAFDDNSLTIQAPYNYTNLINNI